MAERGKEHPDTNVTVLLPRRTDAWMSRWDGRCTTAPRTRSRGRSASSRTRRRRSCPTTCNHGSRRPTPERFEQRVARGSRQAGKAWVPQLEDRQRRGQRAPRTAVVSDHDRAGRIPGQRATVEGRVGEIEDIAKRRGNVPMGSWWATTAGRSASDWIPAKVAMTYNPANWCG